MIRIHALSVLVLLLSLGVLVGGCGPVGPDEGVSPTISELTISPRSGVPGTEVVIRVLVKDRERNVRTVVVRSEVGGEEAFPVTRVQEESEDRYWVAVKVSVSREAPRGKMVLRVWVRNAQGRESNRLTGEFMVLRPELVVVGDVINTMALYPVGVKVTGEVTNRGDVGAVGAVVILTFVDEEGTALGSGKGWIGALSPGQIKPFEVFVEDVVLEEVDSFRVTFDYRFEETQERDRG